MKQIFENQYIKSFKFSSNRELSDFVINQDTNHKIELENSYGDNYYCYVAYHSLTRAIKFLLYFNSNEQEESLNLLFWKEINALVIETGEKIFFIDSQLKIKLLLDITTPLIGFYITDQGDLLILEEASLRILNCAGNIIKYELFDLIEEFHIEKNQLFIRTSEGENKFFSLNS